MTALADRLSDAGAAVKLADNLVPDLAAAHQTYVRRLTTVISQGQPGPRPMDAHAWLAAVSEQHRVRREWAALFATGTWS